MTQRLATVGRCAALALAVIATTPARIGAQAATTKTPLRVRSAATSAGAPAGGVPRTADGHPDLQGTYDLGTLTPLERTKGSPLILSVSLDLPPCQ